MGATGAAISHVARPAPPREARPRVTVLVPAHDEGDRILSTLEGLWSQTLPPTRVVVVADNCSDDTASLARSAGAEVFETVGNADKKAGARHGRHADRPAQAALSAAARW